jgi:3'-5' exoribonuclease
MAKSWAVDLQEGAAVVSYFLVQQLQLRQRRSGEPFLSLVLADRTGQIGAVLWEGAEERAKEVGEGDIVKVQGLVGSYQRERQLTLSRIRRAQPEEISLEDFRPRSPLDPDEGLARLLASVASLSDPFLRQLLQGILESESVRPALRQAPAAKNLHHATLGGLLEHTVSVVGLCERLADYYPALDRDLLLAAAILHDIGKLREFTWERNFDYTDAGRLVGHISLGAFLVDEAIRAIPGFPASLGERLLHCILSHHGELEWGSPKRPKTLEALVLHYAEDLDGKINAFQGFVRSHPDPQRPGWTQFNRLLDRYLYFGPSRDEETPTEAPGSPGEPA